MPRTPRPIFTKEWQAGLSRSARTAMPAKVRLFSIDGQTYNEETNTYDTATTTLYSGIARVQPLRSSRFEPAPMDSSYWQTVLISVPIEDVEGVDFRVGHQGRVLESELNPAILKYQYNVNEIIDSSNPFERTLLCAVTLDATVEP